MMSENNMLTRKANSIIPLIGIFICLYEEADVTQVFREECQMSGKRNREQI